MTGYAIFNRLRWLRRHWRCVADRDVAPVVRFVVQATVRVAKIYSLYCASIAFPKRHHGSTVHRGATRPNVVEGRIIRIPAADLEPIQFGIELQNLETVALLCHTFELRYHLLCLGRIGYHFCVIVRCHIDFLC